MTRHAIAVTAGGAVAALLIVLPIIFLTTQPPAPEPALLSPQDVNEVMGATDYRVIDSIRKPKDPSYAVTPPECAAIDSSDIKTALAAAGISKVEDQTLHATGNDIHGNVTQVVAKAPSADAANRFLQQRLLAWRRCDGRQYEAGGSKTAASITEDGRTKISAAYQFPDDKKTTCQQIFSAEGAFIVKVVVCDKTSDVQAKANTIASKILRGS